MLLEPTDPAAQAFIADYLNDYPLADFDEAARESDADQCEECQRWFTSRHDFDLDLLDVHGERVCCDCAAQLEAPVNPVREWGTL